MIWENFNNWQKRIWHVPEDIAKKVGSVKTGKNVAILEHYGKKIDLGYTVAKSADLMARVHQGKGGLECEWAFNRGVYSIDCKIQEPIKSGLWHAPLWFVSESKNEIMPEIDVCEAYYGVKKNHADIFRALGIPSKWWIKTRRMETNLHFGKVYKSKHHHKEGNINHGSKGFTDWVTYKMVWDRDVEIFYNDKRVRVFKNFRSPANLIPIISASNGKIIATNFSYSSF